MCGIFGGLALTRPLKDECERAMRLLAHRGPDGEGMAEVDGAALAHTRLRIIDLSCAADQPLWDVSRRAVIVFNGEIYNYRELREECLAAGMTFATASDTEVIVAQYLLRGTAAFDRLNGMFAFCLYDTRDGSGYLVRDRFGIKPLYYAATDRGVLFSSELQPLLGSIDTSLDRGALQAYLQLDFVPTPFSIVRGARKLDSGSFLRVARDATVALEQYRKRRSLPSGEADRDVGRHLDAAVARHLISDVPVGVFLSGGIDSTLVAEAATRITGKPIATFSIGFENATFDESAYFNEVAKAIGSEHHVRILDADALVSMVPEIADRLDEPLADGSIYATTLLSRFAREHVTVALSGDGADELFGGYPTYVAHALARHLPASVLATLRSTSGAVHRLLRPKYDNLTADYKLKKFLDGLDADAVMRHMRWMGTFTPEDLRTLLADYDEEAQAELAQLLSGPWRDRNDGWLENLLRTDQRFYLQDGVLTKVDRASMTVSLEVRVPFLDREMADFADRLPASAKVRGKTTKVLLREYAATKFPASIAKRPKKGFGVPLGHWLRRELCPLLERELSRERLQRDGIFQPDAVHRLLQQHWSGERDNRKQLFNLLSFSMWYERHA
jgi:asparagine synthase (glutamine-hydrolysing)